MRQRFRNHFGKGVFFTLFILIFLALAVGASADTRGTCGEDLQWILSDNGLLTITGTGEMKKGSWPKEEIKEVYIENGVTSIDFWAFYECTNLKSVRIPETITYIANGAFYHCSSLSSIALPTKFTATFAGRTDICIGDDTFVGCSSLASIKIPQGVETIGSRAFSGCTSLCEVILPDSLLDISWHGFYKCSSLTSITIPDKVCQISGHAFEGCSLTSVRLSANIRYLDNNAFDPNVTIIAPAGSYAAEWAQDTSHRWYSNESAFPDLANAKIRAIGDQVYTGSAITPRLVVTYQGTTLKQDTDYYAVYSNNKNIGTASATISGKGNYTGKQTIYFQIVPQKVKGLKLTGESKKLTVSWEKGKNIDGYEIECCLKKDFEFPKKITVSDASTTNIEIKKLKTNKKYYVRIRAFKKVNGKKYVSGWSAVKSAKTSK